MVDAVQGGGRSDMSHLPDKPMQCPERGGVPAWILVQRHSQKGKRLTCYGKLQNPVLPGSNLNLCLCMSPCSGATLGDFSKIPP